jgi:hypothetical protein
VASQAGLLVVTGFRSEFRNQIGDVAQLGERRPCTAEVAGSIPVVSIFGSVFAAILAAIENFGNFRRGCLTNERPAYKIADPLVTRSGFVSRTLAVV